MTSLLKLFNLYDSIAELESIEENKHNALKAYQNAQKFSFIPKINERQYKDNQKELENLKIQESQFIKKLDENLFDLDSIITDEVLQYKNELSIMRRQRSRLLSQLKLIENNLQESKLPQKETFSELVEFFPNVNIQKIENIEKFHIQICSVLKKELTKEKKQIEMLLGTVNQDIDLLENRINEKLSSVDLRDSKTLSKSLLMKYSELIKRSEVLKKENKYFEEKRALDSAYKIASERVMNMRREQLSILQNQINTKILEINDLIYASKKKAPILHFRDLQYDFFTPDDTGTGSSYKGLVVFDLSVLELTVLPILVHDSVVLKQIADEAIENILKQYENIGKQVFISLDKVTSYSAATQKILNDSAVLRLSIKGKELFGRSWNKREN